MGRGLPRAALVPRLPGAIIMSSLRDFSLRSAVGDGVEGVAANGGYDAGGWGDYANAVAGKVGAVLFAGCVAGVEGEGKDVETECYAKSVNFGGDEQPGYSLCTTSECSVFSGTPNHAAAKLALSKTRTWILESFIRVA